MGEALTMTIRKSRRELFMLLALAGIQFTHFVDFMIMMPLGPQFRAAWGISDATFGLLVSAYTVSAGLSGLLAALWIDRVDRKKALLTLYGLFAIATVLCGLAQGHLSFLAARVAAGLFGGVLSALIQTIVSEHIPFERRGRAMGVVMTSFSIATVAGVPLGLFIAAHSTWHMPFFALGIMSALTLIAAAQFIPISPPHGDPGKRPAMLADLHAALTQKGHIQALAFTFCAIFVGFSTIPYITLYMQSNVGLAVNQIPFIYLIGGTFTLFSSRLIGVFSDRYGPSAAYVALSILTMLPMWLLTTLPAVHLWVALIVTTLFFIFVSGRMIPAMAMVTAASLPQLRGTFMALNSSVQSLGVGMAAWVGGIIISRDANHLIVDYWGTALVSLIATCCSIWLVRKMVMYDQKSAVSVAA